MTTKQGDLALLGDPVATSFRTTLASSGTLALSVW
jgi:hypothetical protein